MEGKLYQEGGRLYYSEEVTLQASIKEEDSKGSWQSREWSYGFDCTKTLLIQATDETHLLLTKLSEGLGKPSRVFVPCQRVVVMEITDQHLIDQCKAALAGLVLGGATK